MTETQQPSAVPEGAKSSYDRWVEGESMAVNRTFFVGDIGNVELDGWKPKGGKGTFLHKEGAGPVNNFYICEIPPGKRFKVQRQLFKETICGISGRAATTVWNPGDRKQTFEWPTGSLFSLFWNMCHQLFNGSGSEKYQGVGKKYQPSLDNKKGGSQIEYTDEGRIVREWFHEASANRGMQGQMAKH